MGLLMKRFFLNLKMERVWRRDYANHVEAARDVTDYIVGFYNVRLHSKLGDLSLATYEQDIAENTLSGCPKMLDHYTSNSINQDPNRLIWASDSSAGRTRAARFEAFR